MKIAVTTDSGSGINQIEAKELGIKVIPMPMLINDETYYEGINISQDEFYSFLTDKNSKISTSQPAMNDVKKIWDEVLEEYDEVIHIPFSSGLSGTCQSNQLLAEDYDGKVTVVDNKKLSVMLRQSVLDAKTLVEMGKSAKEVKDILESHRDDSYIYIGLDTLDNLKRGGRLSPAAAALGSLLRIKPVLSIKEGERLDSFAKVRTKKAVKKVIIDALRDTAKEKFNDPQCKHTYIGVAYCENEEEAKEFIEEIKEAFPERMSEEIIAMPLSHILACHIGPGGLGAAVFEKLPELR